MCGVGGGVGGGIWQKEMLPSDFFLTSHLAVLAT